MEVPDNRFPLSTLSITYFWKPQAKSMKMTPNIMITISKVAKLAKLAKIIKVAKVAKVTKEESVASSASASVSITATATTLTLS